MPNPYSTSGPDTGYIPRDNPDLLIGYSRNIATFRVAQYCPIKPVDAQHGLYKRFNPTVNYRMGANWKAEAVWAPGSVRPNGLTNRVELEFVQYSTTRLDEPVVIDDLAVQQSNWPVEDVNAQMIAQKHMTRRTLFAQDALASAAWGTNAAPVDFAQGGSLVQLLFPAATAGNWTTGTTAQPNIANCLIYAAQQIQLATGAAVDPSELCLVLNPNMARQIAMSQEIRTTLAQSQYAGQLITGTDSVDGVIAAYNIKWGLPLAIAGFPVVIEDAVWTTEKAGSNPVGGSYVMPDNTAYLLRRTKTLQDITLPRDNPAREAFFPVQTTLCQFTLEEMTAEAFPDARNRMTDAHIASNYQIQVVSTLSGFRFSHIVS